MIKVSKEVKDNKKLIKSIEDEIVAHVFDFVFKEAFEIISTSYQDEFLNAPRSVNIGVILKGIKEGNIIIDKYGNAFVRSTNASISKALKELGGMWNKSKRTYKIDVKKYPIIAQYQTVKNDQIKQNLRRLDTYLIDKETEIKNKPPFEIPEDKVKVLIEDMVKNVKIAIPQKGEGFGIVKKIDEQVIQEFTDTYLKTTSLPIVNMEQRAVERLRKKLMPLVMEGGYTQRDLAKYIEKEFGETKRHAKFLARQETRLIKAQIIKDRALSLGHTKYIWQTAGDQKVRDCHRELNKNVYDFNAPPIIDDKGNHGNPGDAFNCRCIARIILSE